MLGRIEGSVVTIPVFVVLIALVSVLLVAVITARPADVPAIVQTGLTRLAIDAIVGLVLLRTNPADIPRLRETLAGLYR
ncbi:hypothetical protein [Streptomyces sp. RKAG337]|uniref:hypothetical protein n=1 Tax=Streptomyces sp. RKAG337 TaxID=2893404 RepID=UPI0020338B49|nr:hypothetical protein [Streptomyces sp. RKAG337]MCM2425048.1 hypothetical protein [Streptomyces sp. RKAG337]